MPTPSAPSTSARLRAAVIGLGQVGSRFDEEPGRKVVWSHAGAYLQLSDRFELVGAVDISPANAAAFRTRCPAVPIYEDVGRLIAQHRPQIASICTPAETHSQVLFELLQCPDLRMVWCEKPLAADIRTAQQMVEACRARGILLMVSFNRHWLPLWRRARTLVAEGKIGALRSVRVALPNRLLSIGSHAVDLALMLGGPVETLASLPLPALEETGEPAVAALLRHRSGVGGIVQVTGFRSQLVVEAEAIGDDGRLLVREDRGTIATELFETSTAYAGYRQLGAAKTETVDMTGFSPFVAMAENAAAALATGAALDCDGAHALEVQRILELMAAAAR